MEFGTEDLDSNLQIYPNPVRGFFTIHSSTLLQEVEIYDVTGRLVEKVLLRDFKDEASISTKGMASGVYFLQVKGLNKECINKFIVTK
jgi:hypothetical protein